MNNASYSIWVDSNLIQSPPKWLPNDFIERQYVVITDDTVKQYYASDLINSLNVKHKPLVLSFPPGEKSKNYQTKEYLENEMLKNNCDRHTIILALGGGVVGDMAGFVAATYMRGISYIQIPTTLLAMVDSSVGGKTGLDTIHGKNLIGAFWNPVQVVSDINCLKTLSRAHLMNGYFEVLKMFLIKDLKSFSQAFYDVEKILQCEMDLLKMTIQKAVNIKKNIVDQDLHEKNSRAILNFGHTIAHAIEKVMHYTILHGVAVAYGLLVESKISQLLGLLSQEEFMLIRALLSKLNISGNFFKTLDNKQIIHATKMDKKNKEGKVHYILLKKIGEIYENNALFSHPVSDEIVNQALIEVSEDIYAG